MKRDFATIGWKEDDMVKEKAFFGVQMENNSDVYSLYVGDWPWISINIQVDRQWAYFENTVQLLSSDI